MSRVKIPVEIDGFPPKTSAANAANAMRMTKVEDDGCSGNGMIGKELRAASDDKLRSVVDFADPMVLRALIYHATGDDELLRIKISRVSGLFVDAPSITDPASLKLLRTKGFELLVGYRDGTSTTPARSASPDRLLQAMTLLVDQEVPRQEFDFWREEMGIDPTLREFQWKKPPDQARLKAFKVVVVGAGLGGINAAIQLKKAGFEFQVFEKNPEVGGTWYQNRYPGARVDFPSRIYSHTFAMDYHFKYAFSPREETQNYINWCVDKHGVRDRIRFNTEVLKLDWNDAESFWEVHFRGPDGVRKTCRANGIICAVGLLDRPSIPSFAGLDSFEGRWFHTSAFDSSLDLAGKRVAIIGTGATGMQLAPELAASVKHMTIFQRSPGWVVPIEGYRDMLPADVQWLHRNVPYYAHWTRLTIAWAIGDHTLGRFWDVDPDWKDPNTPNEINFRLRNKLVAYLKEKVGHRPDLVQKLLPKYPPLAKRYIVDNGWFDAALRDNVDIIADDPISHFVRDGIVTQSGKEVKADVAILATGYRANQFFWPMEVLGRGGVSVETLWAKDGPRAFWTVAIAGVPNFFCMYGPNGNPRSTGVVPYGEMQVAYALKCFAAMVLNGWKSIDVRQDVFDKHNKLVDDINSKMIILDKRQKSYWTNEFGRSAVMSPWKSLQFWTAMREPNFDEYIVDGKRS